MTALAGALAGPQIPIQPDERLIGLQWSEWESAFFSARMGALVLRDPTSLLEPACRAELLARDMGEALARAATECYEHLIFRVPAHDMVAIWAAERCGLHLVDVGIDLSFSFSMTGIRQVCPEANIRRGRLEDIPALQAMTDGAYHLSRFAVDPFFTPQQVSDFYKEWVSKLFDGLADVVFVCEIDTELAGFVSVTLTSDRARIPLVATRADLRRRGVARDLLTAALHSMAEAGARVAYVKTQAANNASLALYQRSGFVSAATELTFSATLSPTNKRCPN